MRFAAASLPFLYQEDFDALRHDRAPSVRERLIAYNFSLPADIQEKLVKSRSPRLRDALAKNKQIDPKIFLRLVNDSDREVRKNSLENPLCPQEYGACGDPQYGTAGSADSGTSGARRCTR